MAARTAHSDAVGAVDLRASSGSRVSCVRVGCTCALPRNGQVTVLYLAEKSGGHTGCGSRGPLRAWRRAGGGWARREGSHRREVLVATEPSQRSRARAWRPEWCPHEHTNSPTDRGGARHRDLRPRPDEGWNRAEAASSCTAAVDSFSPLSDGGAAFSGENDRIDPSPDSANSANCQSQPRACVQV